MPLIDLTHENFDDETDRFDLILLDFWAEWCAPCKSFAPIYEAASRAHPDVLFARINTEQEPVLARQFQVQSIPTLLAVKSGTVVEVKIGALTHDALERLIGNLRV